MILNFDCHNGKLMNMCGRLRKIAFNYIMLMQQQRNLFSNLHQLMILYDNCFGYIKLFTRICYLKQQQQVTIEISSLIYENRCFKRFSPKRRFECGILKLLPQVILLWKRLSFHYPLISISNK